MPYYRFYFLDAKKQIVGHHIADLPDTAEAAAYAERLLSRGCYSGIEVWERSLLLVTKTKIDDPKTES